MQLELKIWTDRRKFNEIPLSVTISQSWQPTKLFPKNSKWPDSVYAFLYNFSFSFCFLYNTFDLVIKVSSAKAFPWCMTAELAYWPHNYASFRFSFTWMLTRHCHIYSILNNSNSYCPNNSQIKIFTSRNQIFRNQNTLIYKKSTLQTIQIK